MKSKIVLNNSNYFSMEHLIGAINGGINGGSENSYFQLKGQDNFMAILAFNMNSKEVMEFQQVEIKREEGGRTV